MGDDVTAGDLASVRRGWRNVGGGAEHSLFRLGAAAIDEAIGGLSRAAVHEILAASGDDAAAAAGFALALSARAAPAAPLCWIARDLVGFEAGRLHPPGLTGLGLDPGRVTLVGVRHAVDGLRAAEEATRCRAVGAVVLTAWGGAQDDGRGEDRAWNLTASRRLALAARASGATLFVLRLAAREVPSAVATRWRVAAHPSRPAPANAPGAPAFRVDLLRHAGPAMGGAWCVEWNRDRLGFDLVRTAVGEETLRPTLPRPVVPVSADRPDRPADRGDTRRAG